MTALICFLAAAQVLMCICHTAAAVIWARERRDMLNRIMAKSGGEYIRISSADTEKRETKRQRRARKWRSEVKDEAVQ